MPTLGINTLNYGLAFIRNYYGALYALTSTALLNVSLF